MKILEMIENYKKNCIAQHLEKDYVLGLKYLKINNKIVNDVFDKGMEQEFFDKLFKEKNPWILSDAAFDSFNHHYMLHESLNIIHWCKKNADSLIFCDDLELNRKSQLFFKNDSFFMYEENVNFYDEAGDYLYKKYFDYRHMLEMQYRFLCGYSKKNFNESIIYLLDELNNNQKLNDFYEAISKRFTLCEDYMVSLTLNAYYMYNYFDNKEKTIKTLKSVLSYKKITIDLRNLIKKILIKIES